MQRKRAFTLIELLVVIAIIAILAAILFPVFAKARENAKKSKSGSNIRQLGLAVQQYSNDYNEMFPGYLDESGTGTKYVHNTWDEQIDPFVKAKDVYSNGDTGIASPSQPRPHNRVLTYVINGALLCPWNNGDVVWAQGSTAPTILSTSALTNPSNTILFAEIATAEDFQLQMNLYKTITPGTNAPTAHNTGTGTASNQYTGAWGGSTDKGYWIDASPIKWVENNTAGAANYAEATWKPGFGIARDLYGGGGNYAFCDGHVKFQRLSFTTTSGQTGVNAHQNWNSANTAVIQYNQWYPG